jgi:hypothetical protein
VATGNINTNGGGVVNAVKTPVVTPGVNVIKLFYL